MGLVDLSSRVSGFVFKYFGFRVLKRVAGLANFCARRIFHSKFPIFGFSKSHSPWGLRRSKNQPIEENADNEDFCSVAFSGFGFSYFRDFESLQMLVPVSGFWYPPPLKPLSTKICLNPTVRSQTFCYQWK